MCVWLFWLLCLKKKRQDKTAKTHHRKLYIDLTNPAPSQRRRSSNTLLCPETQSFSSISGLPIWLRSVWDETTITLEMVHFSRGASTPKPSIQILHLKIPDWLFYLIGLMYIIHLLPIMSSCIYSLMYIQFSLFLHSRRACQRVCCTRITMHVTNKASWIFGFDANLDAGWLSSGQRVNGLLSKDLSIVYSEHKRNSRPKCRHPAMILQY